MYNIPVCTCTFHMDIMARDVVFMPWLDATVLLKVHVHVGVHVVVSLF